MKRTLSIGACVVLALFFAGSAFGQTTMAYNPTDDAYVAQPNPNGNYGSASDLHVCTYDGNPIHNDDFEQNSFLLFDVSGIPTGATVNSARLYLYYHHWHDNDPAGRPLNIYRATGGWDEGTITYNTQPPTAVTPTTATAVPPTFGWMSWDVTVDVALFVADPLQNMGWKIMDNGSWNMFNIPIAYFYAKENGTLMPYLEVTYTSAQCLLNCPTGVTLVVGTQGTGNKSPDMDGNGVVNLVDLANFAMSWPPGPYNYCADFDCSGAIGLQDVALFAQHWGHAGPFPGICQ